MKSFEVNGPATILNLFQVHTCIMKNSPEEKECMRIAEQMIAWFKQLNREGCKPTTTWTEFIHQEKPRTAADIKQAVLDSFKDSDECVYCQGDGFVTPQGAPSRTCYDCNGTGKRRK